MINPGVLPDGYVAVDPTPLVSAHAEASFALATDPEALSAEARSRLGSFRCRALVQRFAPSALAALPADVLVNDHGEQVITVCVMPLAAMPPGLADALSRGPVAGPIPPWVSDETVDHRSLKQIRSGFVVGVQGHFDQAGIREFTANIELDVAAVGSLLS